MTVSGPAIAPRQALRRDRRRLLQLLRELASADWDRPTVCGSWRVRDVVAHILGDDLGRLSRSRDRHDGGDSPAEGESFAEFIDRLNQCWVAACVGRSPDVLVEQLVATTPALLNFWDALDLTELGEPVTWADPEPAPRWLDCARDVTEYWTHQRQIRDAVDREHPADPEVDHVVIDTFLRAVPHALRDVDAAPGSTVRIDVPGRAGGRWSWAYHDGGWAWHDQLTASSTATVEIDHDTLWRLCTRGIEPSTAQGRARLTGPSEITYAATSLVSIIR